MSRGENAGGGQSSLGYLFGSDEKQRETTTPPPTPVVYAPPYGIDTKEETPQQTPPPSDKLNVHRKPQGLNSGNIITGRPSTKVKSPPGGDSSLGYLFGEKS